MSSDDRSSHSITVVKIGGSVLTDTAAYERVARFLRSRVRGAERPRIVAVVSAQHGHTDDLLGAAQSIVRRPNPVMLDLLWSTGELRSVALLVFHLHALGVRATGLNVQQAGLRVIRESGAQRDGVQVDPWRLTRALEKFLVVVVPGFLATRRSGSIVSLGRGGSDLSAVLLATGLNAERCELIKDVPGYFDVDPAAHAAARQLPQVSYERALEMARAGCELVQPAALEAAARAGLHLVIRSLDESAQRTEIRACQPRSAAALFADEGNREPQSIPISVVTQDSTNELPIPMERTCS